MKLETNTGTYEQYNLKKLNDNDLEKFWRIIQETWSFFFGEYTKCTNCGNISSKKDIYEGFSSQYSKYTVEELEKKFKPNLNCNSEGCEGKTKYIWGESFIQELEQALIKNIHANLITYKNRANEIVGLGYSYINTLKKIYEQDLYCDFSESEFSKTKLDQQFNIPFLLPTGLSIIEREKKFKTVINTWTLLFQSAPDEYNNLSGIFAALKGSKTSQLYYENGAFDHGIKNIGTHDIQLLQQNHMIETYKKNISLILI